MKMTRKAHRSIHVQNILFYLLFTLVLGLLAFLGRQYVYQADWTYGNRNSLSETTEALLQTIAGSISFIAYVPDEPALREQLRSRVKKYQRLRDTIRLEFVNPDLDPVRAQQDGIQYAGQLAIRLGDKTEVVESMDEQVIANALQRMSRGGERLIVFLEGHGERNPMAEHSSGMAQLLATLGRSGFIVQPHSLVRSQSVPDNARFLVIASPQQALLDGEVAVLVDYVEQGGNLLWLQDPATDSDAEVLASLSPLADVLGVNIAEGTVVDANEQLHALLGIDHPAVVPVVDYGRSVLGDELTGSQSLFPFATGVSRQPEAAASALEWQVDEFLNTLPNSWLETASIDGDIAYGDNEDDQLGPISLGLALTRLLESPDSAADDASNSGSKTSAASDDLPTMTTEGERQQRVVVIGDSDFLSNSFVGRGVNLDLAANIFNWLSADDNLLNIRSVSAPDTRFEMSERLSVGLALFFLFVLPLGLIAAGVLIWWWRRRR